MEDAFNVIEEFKTKIEAVRATQVCVIPHRQGKPKHWGKGVLKNGEYAQEKRGVLTRILFLL